MTASEKRGLLRFLGLFMLGLGWYRIWKLGKPGMILSGVGAYLAFGD